MSFVFFLPFSFDFTKDMKKIEQDSANIDTTGVFQWTFEQLTL